MAKLTLVLVLLFSLFFASALDASRTNLLDQTKGLDRSGPSPGSGGKPPDAPPAQTTTGLIRSGSSHGSSNHQPGTHPMQTIKGELRSESFSPDGV